MKRLNKVTILIIIFLILILGGAFFLLKKTTADNNPQMVSLNNSNISQTITASGDVEAQNQQTLTFLNVGRVTYLGVKEGDSVKSGQILANLDSTIASHNETASEAQYRSAQSALNKVIDDIHLFQYGNGGDANVGTANETQTQKTQRQQAEEAVNSAFDNMQNAKKQLDLLSIISPFDGTILTIQNLSVGTNVSPTSGSNITVVGGGVLKFVANVLDQDIDKLHVGEEVTIKLDSKKDKVYSGTINKIAEGKTTMTDGSNVFKVDIESNDLQAASQPGETGSLQIMISGKDNSVVSSWTILGNKYIWVSSKGSLVLKEVTIGVERGNQTEIKSGLEKDDQVILDPEIIAKGRYTLL